MKNDGLIYVALIVIVLMGAIIVVQQETMTERASSGPHTCDFVDLDIQIFSGSEEVYNITANLTREGKIDLWPINELRPISFYEIKIKN